MAKSDSMQNRKRATIRSIAPNADWLLEEPMI